MNYMEERAVRIEQATMTEIERTPKEYFRTTAYDRAWASYATREEAEGAQRVQPHPHNWYVWQMNDGSWHISLKTNREA